eukprot:1435724-Rhodomonas_salina.2
MGRVRCFRLRRALWQCARPVSIHRSMLKPFRCPSFLGGVQGGVRGLEGGREGRWERKCSDGGGKEGRSMHCMQTESR